MSVAVCSARTQEGQRMPTFASAAPTLLPLPFAASVVVPVVLFAGASQLLAEMLQLV